MEKRGGRKTSRMTPLPKRGFVTPPLVRYVFHPPQVSVLCFFLYKNPRQSRSEALLGGSKNSRGSAFSGTFPPPIRFAPPPYHGPKFPPKLLGQKSCRTKVPRIFRIFVPDFAPNFAPNFPRIFQGFFVLRFVETGDQNNFTKNPAIFQCKIPRQTRKKRFTKCFWRAGNVRN